MTINLEDYLKKTVEVELRNGNVVTGKVGKTFGVYYIGGFHKNGMTIEYYEDGTSFDLDNPTNQHLHDIIKIKETNSLPQPETMTNVIRSKIDVFTTEDERVEVTLDDDGLFLTACSKGAREDLSIVSKDLVIEVAKAILEHYNVPYTV
jgi:hypothetical protein